MNRGTLELLPIPVQGLSLSRWDSDSYRRLRVTTETAKPLLAHQKRSGFDLRAHSSAWAGKNSAWLER